MIGFLLRKTFYDLWDNLFKIVVLNLGVFACSAIVFIPAFIPGIFGSNAMVIIFSIIGIFVTSIYLAAVSRAIKPISDYGTFTFGEFLKAFKSAWPAGIVMGIFVLILFYIISEVFRFYLFDFEPQLLGLAITAVIFWITIYAVISFQYFFSVVIRLGPALFKSIKKCMLISLDNTGLSIFLIFNNIIAFVLSVFFAFMFPGPAGILLYLDEALRLRLLKYDWLEENPEANRRKIPWDAILIEERERTGTRTLRNFIFPWKD
ncbi:MAG: hypothetical protein FWC22_07570 [Treponema sp.]|nr:hypothetical protein [Treponema sp.]